MKYLLLSTLAFSLLNLVSCNGTRKSSSAYSNWQSEEIDDPTAIGGNGHGNLTHAQLADVFVEHLAYYLEKDVRLLKMSTQQEDYIIVSYFSGQEDVYREIIGYWIGGYTSESKMADYIQTHRDKFYVGLQEERVTIQYYDEDSGRPYRDWYRQYRESAPDPASVFWGEIDKIHYF